MNTTTRREAFPIGIDASLVSEATVPSEIMTQRAAGAAADPTQAVAQRALSRLQSILEKGILSGKILKDLKIDWTSSADAHANERISVVCITSTKDLYRLKVQAACNPFSVGLERGTDNALLTKIGSEEIAQLLRHNGEVRKMLQCRVQRIALCILTPRLRLKKVAPPEYRTDCVPTECIEKIIIDSDFLDELKSNGLHLTENKGRFFSGKIQIVPISSTIQTLLYPVRTDHAFYPTDINLYAPDFFSLLEGYLTPRQVGNFQVESRYSSEKPLIIHAVRLCDMTTLEECEHLIDLTPEVRIPQLEIERSRERPETSEQLDREEMLTLWQGPGGFVHQIDPEEGGGGIAGIPHARQEIENQRSPAPHRNLLTLARNKVTGFLPRFKKQPKEKEEDSLL